MPVLFLVTASQIKTKRDNDANVPENGWRDQAILVSQLLLTTVLNILKRVTGTVRTGADDVLYKTEKKENWRSTAKTVTHVEKATG